MKLQIRKLEVSDIENYIQHLTRHFREYGVGGVLVNPYPVDEPWESEAFSKNLPKLWQAHVASGDGWEVVWGLFHEEKIVGHVDLYGQSLPFFRHRCKLGTGVENAYRSHGYGKKLLSTAIEWTKQQPSLEWIDLNVFAQNHAAIKFYTANGFREVGRVPDRLRVKDQKIEDLHMAREILR